MYRGETVGVVIPAYNEAGYVGEVIETLPPHVDRAYVVDDASTDDTWAEIRAAAKRINDSVEDGEATTRRGDQDPVSTTPDAAGAGPVQTVRAHSEAGTTADFEGRVVPLQHAENRGVGGAIKTGYNRALADGTDLIAVMGGDGQMNPDDLTRYLDPLVEDEADYVKGNRFMADDIDQMPRFRLVGNVTLSVLTKIASGYWSIGDPQNGYTAATSDALQAVDLDGMYEYYGYCNDLLVKLQVADQRVADIPRPSTFTYSDDWKSHISYTEYIPRVSAMLLRNFLERLRHESPSSTIPYVLGAFFMTVGLALTVRSRRRGLLTTGVGVVLLAVGAGLDRREDAQLGRRLEPEA